MASQACPPFPQAPCANTCGSILAKEMVLVDQYDGLLGLTLPGKLMSFKIMSTASSPISLALLP